MQNQDQNQQEQSQQQSDKILFVVSSAIYAKHGIYSKEERMSQTIETCKSIRKYAPDADIVLLDGGYKNIEKEDQAELKDYITMFYSFADSESVRSIQEVNNWDIVKNMIEIIIFGSFYNQEKDNLKKYKRIFKMSGRYTLNDEFNLQDHLNADKQIVVRGPFTSQFDSSITGGVTLQYMSRLWSFDSILIDYISEVYRFMFNHMQDRLSAGGYIDIEHLMYDHLDNNVIKLVNKIGVQGNIAPNGASIKE